MSSDSDVNALSDGMEKLSPSPKKFKADDGSSSSNENGDNNNADYNDEEYDAYENEKDASKDDDEEGNYSKDENYYSPDSFMGSSETPNAQILERAVEIVTTLLDGNQILVPTSKLAEIVDISKCPTIGASKKSKLLYAVVEVVENNKLKILKIAGATSNGEVRATHLDKQYGKDEQIYYLTLCNLEYMQEETNNYVLNAILDICKTHNTLEQLEGMSIADASESQEGKDRPPFTLQLLLHWIDKRNAYKIHGLLKRLALHIIESGFEELSKTLEGLEFAKGATEAFTHEFLRGKYLLRMAEMNMKSAVGRLTGFLKKLEDKYGKRYVEYLSTTGIIVKALSSWSPDLEIYGFTPAILDAIFGKGKWKNVFLRPPVVRGNGDLYDTSNYTKKDFRDAEANLDEFMKESRNSGEFNFLDDNKLLFSKMGTTADKYLIGKKFVFVDNVDGVLYYAAKEDDWDFPAMIGLHSPPCPIGNSNPDVKVDQRWVNTSRDTAKKIGSIQLLCAYLQTSDAEPSDFFSDDMRRHRVLGNVLVMQCFLEYLVVHLHYYRMGANVIGKDFMANFGVIDEAYTKLILQFPYAISRYMTRRLSYPNEPPYSRNYKLYTNLLTCLTIERDDAEIKDAIDRLLKLLFEFMPTAADKRGKKIERLKEMYGLKDDFYEMLKERYDIAEASYKDELDESFDSGTLQEQSVALDKRCQGDGDY